MSAANGSQATTPDNSGLLAIAVEAVNTAAALIHARTADLARLEWNEKGTADFVTDVDREAEAAIAALIAQRLPGARTLGEELAPHQSDVGGTVFIVDPIDGTTNFLHGYPEYAVSVGVARDGQLVAGAIKNVPRGELFTASAGAGAFRDGSRVTVSAITQPSRALVGTGFPFKHRQYIPLFLQQLERVISNTAGVRRAGSASLDLANVACGRFDAFWELMLAPWDVAAGILLVREAGGIVTDLDGMDSLPAHAPVVAANAALHPWLLEILNESRSRFEAPIMKAPP